MANLKITFYEEYPITPFENVEYKAEFNTLQAYRESCKIKSKLEIG